MAIGQLVAGFVFVGLSARPPGFDLSARTLRIIQLAVRAIGIAYIVGGAVSLAT